MKELNQQALNNIRNEFPILSQALPNGQDLTYLDSAATTLKPKTVVDRLSKFYLYEASNVHRGAHFLSDQATGFFEAARQKAANFLSAGSVNEIVFTSGTTEAVNLVSHCYARQLFQPGDEILISEMEHHSSIVPWQILAEEKALQLKVIPVTDIGELDYEAYLKLLSSKTRMVALTHCSNTLGTVNPVEQYIEAAHAVGAKVFVDGAQSISILPVDVVKMKCDFFAFSTHKLFGPFGHGVLYGREGLLSVMTPYQGGGSMINKVSFAGTTFESPPLRFEAGTPHVAGAVGLAAAIDFVLDLGLESIASHEQSLVRQLEANLANISGCKIIGRSPSKVNIVSFQLEGVHHSDVGTLLDQKGIAVRVGHHCTQPLMERFNIAGTIRASFSVYNTKEDVEKLSHALDEVKSFF